MNRKKYQIFTPSHVVKKMLDLIGYKGSIILDKKIIDISCGDGAFLAEILDRLIIECKKINMEESDILKTCANNIYGVEKEEDVYSMCIRKLNAIIRNNFRKHYVHWSNVTRGDGLCINEKSFDFVVGNPPYISYKEMTPEQRNFLSSNFDSCKAYRFDYSYAFIEKNFSIMSETGKGCIISPINMYKIKSGLLIKEQLRPLLTKIIDVTEDNIFPGVLTNPVISVFEKNNKNNSLVIEKTGSKPRIVCRYNFENEIDPYKNKSERRFGDYFEVHSGVATLLNNAFLVDVNAKIENELLRNARSPKFERHHIKKSIIFPYLTDDNKICRISEKVFKKKFPHTFEHLSLFKNELEQRSVSDGIMWYEYGRTQALENMLKDKIMIPAIMSIGVKPIMLKRDDVVFAGLYIIEKDPERHPLSEAFEILSNNKLLYKYIKHSGVKMSGGSFRFGPNILEDYRY